MFLVQLWFDTFMLHEDQFKAIISVYKQLRQDGVVFPIRDPNSEHFIDFKGKKSPIFESIEGGRIYEEPNKELCIKKYRVRSIDVQSDIGQEFN